MIFSYELLRHRTEQISTRQDSQDVYKHISHILDDLKMVEIRLVTRLDLKVQFFAASTSTLYRACKYMFSCSIRAAEFKSAVRFALALILSKLLTSTSCCTCSQPITALHMEGVRFEQLYCTQKSRSGVR